VESSEQAILSEVARTVATKDWIVFMGWAPNPMNVSLTWPILRRRRLFRTPIREEGQSGRNPCRLCRRFAQSRTFFKGLKFTVADGKSDDGLYSYDGSRRTGAATNISRNIRRSLIRG